MMAEVGVSRLDELREKMEAAKRRLKAAMETKRRFFAMRNACDSAGDRAENHNQCMAAEREVANARDEYNAAATTYTDDSLKEALKGDDSFSMM